MAEHERSQLAWAIFADRADTLKGRHEIPVGPPEPFKGRIEVPPAEQDIVILSPAVRAAVAVELVEPKAEPKAEAAQK